MTQPIAFFDNKQKFDDPNRKPPMTVSRRLAIAQQLDEFFSEAISQCCGTKDKCSNCCSWCATANGHFELIGSKIGGKFAQPYTEHVLRTALIDQVPAALAQLNKLKKDFKWTAKKGFLTKTGCSLPRDKRSVYCQSTHCVHMDPYLGNKNWALLEQLLTELREMRINSLDLIY